MKTAIAPVFVNHHASETRIVRELANHRCQCCEMEFFPNSDMAKTARWVNERQKWPVMGTVHHIDGNDDNWRWNNLLYVCCPCARKLKFMRSQTDDMPTKLTLILPDILGEKATLVIERNDLATVEIFNYDHEDNVLSAIRDAQRHLGIIEANPPPMPPPAPLPAKPETPSTMKVKKDSSKAKVAPAKPAEPVEPTYALTLKYNTQRTIPQSLLYFSEGTQDAALTIASRLFELGVWDLKKPIRVNEPEKTLAKMNLYTDKQLKGLFELTDFAQLVDARSAAKGVETTATPETQPEQELETVTE